MKRFSWRETAFLCLPVVVVAIVGWGLSKRRRIVPDQTVRLIFRIEKPTTLEAFQGQEAAFVVEAKKGKQDYSFYQASPYLQVQAPHETQISRLDQESANRWGDVWGGYVNNSRFLFKVRPIPKGQLSFGFYGLAYPPSVSGTVSPPPTRVSGQWKVDRRHIEPLTIAALPRKPLISVFQVKISRVAPGQVSGEMIFRLDGAAMGENTPLEMSVSNSVGTGMSWGTPNGTAYPERGRRRVRYWKVYNRPSNRFEERVQVFGRVSADGRWPLGFEIAPFKWKTAKVGQNLKFKTFPVALPKADGVK